MSKIPGLQSKLPGRSSIKAPSYTSSRRVSTTFDSPSLSTSASACTSSLADVSDKQHHEFTTNVASPMKAPRLSMGSGIKPPSKVSKVITTTPAAGDAKGNPPSTNASKISIPNVQSMFKIGDNVTTGTRTGVLRFLGTTHFADGTWAGIELDMPNGKNDGAVDGVRYFECRHKYGLFAPMAKLRIKRDVPMSPVPATANRKTSASPVIGFRKPKVHNTTNTAPTVSSLADLPTELALGTRVRVGVSKLGVIRFLGETKFAEGIWAGIELDQPQGKNDGALRGVRYFQTRPLHGIFASPSKLTVISSGEFAVNTLNFNDFELSDTDKLSEVDATVSRVRSMVATVTKSQGDHQQELETALNKLRDMSDQLATRTAEMEEAKALAEGLQLSLDAIREAASGDATATAAAVNDLKVTYQAAISESSMEKMRADTAEAEALLLRKELDEATSSYRCAVEKCDILTSKNDVFQSQALEQTAEIDYLHAEIAKSVVDTHHEKKPVIAEAPRVVSLMAELDDVKRQLADREVEVQHLNASVETLTTSQNSLSELLEKTSIREKDSALRMSNLELDLANTKQENENSSAQYKTDIEALHARVDSAEMAAVSEAARATALSIDFDYISDQLASTKTHAESTISNAENDIKVLRSDLSTSQNEVAIVNNRNAELVENLAHVNATLAEVRSAAQKELDTLSEKKLNKLEMLHTDLDTMRRQLEEARTESTNISSSAAEADKHQVSRIHDLEEKITQLTTSSQNDLHTAMENARIDKEAALIEQKRLQVDLDRALSARDEALAKLAAEHDSHASSADELQAKCVSLSGELFVSQSSLSENKAYIERLLVDITSTKKRADDAETAVNVSNIKLNDMAIQLDELAAKLRSAETRNDVLATNTSAIISGLKADVASAKIEADEASSRARCLLEQLDATEKQFNDLKISMLTKEEETRICSAEADRRQTLQVHDLEEKITLLTTSSQNDLHTAMENARIDKEAALIEQKRLQVDLDRALSARDESITKLTAERDCHASAANELQEKCNTLREEIVVALASVSELRGDADRLQVELYSANQSTKEVLILQEELATMKKERGDIEADFENMRKQHLCSHNELQLMYENACKQITTLQVSLDAITNDMASKTNLLNDVEITLESTRIDLIASKKMEKTLNDKLSYLQQQLCDTKHANDSTNENVSVALAQVRDRLSASEEAFASEKLRADETLAKFENVCQQLDASKASHTNAIEMATQNEAALSTQLKALELEVNSKTDRISEITTEFEEARRKFEEVEILLKKDMSSHNNSHNILNESLLEMKDRNSKLSESLDEAQNDLRVALDSRLVMQDEHGHSVRKLQLQCFDLSEELAIVRSKNVDNADNLKMLEEKLNNSMAVSEFEKTRAEEALMELNEKKRSLADLNSDLLTTKDNIVFLHSELDSSKEEVLLLHGTIRELSLAADANKAEASSSMVKSTHDLDRMALENSELQEKILHFKNEVASLQEQLKTVHIDLNASRALEASLRSKDDDNASRLQAAVDDAASTIATVELMAAEKIKLTEMACDNATSSANNAYIRITELELNINDNENAHRSDKKAMEARISKLTQDLSIAKQKAQSNRLVETVDDSTSAVVLAEMQDKLKRSEDSVKFLNEVIATTQQKKRGLEQRFVELQERYNNLNTESAVFSNGHHTPKRDYCEKCQDFTHTTAQCEAPVDVNMNLHPSNHTKEPRPYCNICESFGHVDKECDDEETY